MKPDSGDDMADVKERARMWAATQVTMFDAGHSRVLIEEEPGEPEPVAEHASLEQAATLEEMLGNPLARPHLKRGRKVITSIHTTDERLELLSRLKGHCDRLQKSRAAVLTMIECLHCAPYLSRPAQESGVWDRLRDRLPMLDGQVAPPDATAPDSDPPSPPPPPQGEPAPEARWAPVHRPKPLVPERIGRVAVPVTEDVRQASGSLHTIIRAYRDMVRAQKCYEEAKRHYKCVMDAAAR